MIVIDFKDTHLKVNKPDRILVAESLNQVQGLIKKVEALWNQGYYVAGFVSYEASPAFDAKLKVNPNNHLPLAWFAVFQAPDIEKDQNEIPKEDYAVSKWKSDCLKETYEEAIQAIHHAIAKGDTYQVNHTIRLHADFKGDAGAYYQHLTSLQSGYNAFLDIGQFQILSVSPELFFHWEQDTLITRPMKGTAKRGKTLHEDMLRAQQLKHSVKDRAENLMIVDLLRNDLGKIAIPGSVQVPSVFEIERYPTVWQMTSTIQATTRPTTTLTEVFTALFPCGSITGAPKQKTMDLISSLEQSPREAYCGTIGYLKPGGEAVFNVAIRTVIVDKKLGRATYGVGGGITWDSTSSGEYEEVITKAKILEMKPYAHQLLESIRLEEGAYTLLEKHLTRMKESADYFDYLFPQDEIKLQLQQLANKFPSGVYKVRLRLSSDGRIKIDAQETKEITQPVLAALALNPIDSKNIFLYHKTTERKIYEQHRTKGYFDTLLWNERGEITEFTIGNVVLEIDGKRVTPPIDSGLLAGTMRAKLLETGEVEEQIVYKEDIDRASSIWLVNSVRGWIEVKLEMKQ
ncbi:aminodeoxychorismate synthase component I [Shimazuella alba]|uniref:Aminodeoxychorismate synthase component I n=1 Tax=Shimazuella alba TaxID=2690964 RepID=A0A6I4VY31_9BACL|nr:aminodeoxychorismate synthase component I [Shimazuella alba]MXQ52972.1 aminodeoxychorismate synthase component I [Shimazuella alba]